MEDNVWDWERPELLKEELELAVKLLRGELQLWITFKNLYGGRTAMRVEAGEMQQILRRYWSFDLYFLPVGDEFFESDVEPTWMGAAERGKVVIGKLFRLLVA